MKKSILQFSVIAAIAASMTLTTSCSSDESVAEAYVPEPVQFGIDLGDMTVARANTRTQAANTATGWTTSIDGKFAVNDIVYIWTKDADGKFYRKAYKVKTAAGDSGEDNELEPNGSAASDQFYWQKTDEYKQYEIYSFGKNAIGDSTNIKASDRTYTTALAPAPASLEGVPAHYLYTVPADQSVEASKTEFLFGYGTIKYASSSASAKQLKVSHQLARIDVRILTDKNKYEVTEDQNGDPLNTDPNNTPEDTSDDINFDPTTTEEFELKIGWADMPLKGLFKAPNYTAASSGGDEIRGENVEAQLGSWTPVVGSDPSDKGIITPRVLVEQRYNTTEEKFETQYSAVVMPQTVDKGNDWFTIKYDGATYKYKIPDEDGDSDFDIKPGKKYVYKVVFEDTKIKVNVAIQEWTDGFTGTQEVTAVLQGS